MSEAASADVEKNVLSWKSTLTREADSAAVALPFASLMEDSNGLHCVSRPQKLTSVERPLFFPSRCVCVCVRFYASKRNPPAAIYRVS